MANAGWYNDPSRHAQVRYWDGAQWSQWVADGGASRLDAAPPPDGTPTSPSGWFPDPLGIAQVRYWDGTEWSRWSAVHGTSRYDTDVTVEGLPAPPDVPPPSMAAVPGGGWAPPGTVSTLASTARYRRLGGLATAITVVLVLAVLACIGGLAARIHRLDLVDRVTSGDIPSVSELQGGDDYVGAAASVIGLASIAVFVMFIVFLFRAVKNTELWSSSRPRWTAGWAIGSWFIPIANLVIPFMVVLETFERTEPSDEFRPPRSSSLVLWLWWVVFVVGWIAIQIQPGANKYDDVRTRDWFALVGYVLLAIAGVVMIAVVRRLAKMQETMRAAGAVPA